MRVQYFSDIHLEFGQCVFPHAKADIIVAAGDIAPGIHALPWLAQSDVPIIYIAGNHEYYGGDLSYTLAELRQQSPNHKVHFLERDSFEFQGIRFLGATLWTDFNSGEPSVMRGLHPLMNDFCYIRTGGQKTHPLDFLRLHSASLAWLINELEKDYQGKTVVATHHAPSFDSWHKNADDPRIFGYCSALDELNKRYEIDAWIHGHIHAPCNYRKHNTPILCNPRGYHGIENYDSMVGLKYIDLD